VNVTKKEEKLVLGRVKAIVFVRGPDGTMQPAGRIRIVVGVKPDQLHPAADNVRKDYDRGKERRTD
jgi:hypothetical protein